MKPWSACLYLLAVVTAASPLSPSASISISIVKGVAAATSPDEVLEDPELERRARALSKELRCLVCQNQSIDDSDADLARDLRRLVRERLLAGDTDEEVIAFATERYGDFVLLRPPVKPSTWILWYGPLVIFMFAATGIAFYVRRRRDMPVEAPADELSADEQARLDRLLGQKGADPT